MLKEHLTEHLIAQLFDSQPDSVVWFSPVFDNDVPGKIVDFEATYCNATAAKIFNVDRAELLGASLKHNKLMDERSIELVFEHCCDVWNTGNAIEYTYYSPGFDRYFNVQRSKVEGGVLSIARDRTKEVRAELERQDQEKMYQQILDTSADGIMLLRAVRNGAGQIVDFVLAHCNRVGLEAAQFPPNATGRRILEILPHLAHSPQFELHKKVVETGEAVRFETCFRTPEGEEYGWFIVSLTRMDDAVISTFVDVTEKKANEQQILQQKDLLNNILDASLNAVYTCEAIRDEAGAIIDLRFVQVNQRFKDLSVRPGVDVIGKCLLDEFPATRQTQTLEKLVQVIETGQPARFEVRYNDDVADEWYDLSAVKLGANGVVVTFANISEQKKAVLAIEQQKDLLDNILRYSPSGIALIEAIREPGGEVVDFQHVLVNDLAAAYTGFSKTDLLSNPYARLNPAFSNSPVLAMLAASLRSGEPCFINYELPSGLWIESAVSRMDENCLICVVTDVTEAKKGQAKMESLITELKRSNESLEEFTRAASHDLKEPIRKVQFFSDRLREKLQGRLSADEARMMERMENAANRMTLLVDDLLEYSHVKQRAADWEPINLNTKVQLVLADLELLITETGAQVSVAPLPVVNGYRRQLQQLFHNLIGNAIKYAKPGVPPQIKLTASKVTGLESGIPVATADETKLFYLLEVEDNGIGFEQEYAEKIFHVFTRLHGNSEYSGTGVGLAIVRKVVDNHQGYIQAKGSPGEGATFRVLLPA